MAQGTQYTVTASSILDLAGNVIGTNDSMMFVFPGGAVFDGDTKPRVVGAISVDNATVIVTFSKPMGDSAIDPDHYAIRREGNDPPGGYLEVVGAA